VKGSTHTLLRSGLSLLLIAAAASGLPAGSGTLGKIQFRPVGKTEKLAGVWVDGVYLGYADELKGSNKLVLIPGEHRIVFRSAGYKDFVTTVMVQPGKNHEVPFLLQRDPAVARPDTTSSMKIVVNPARAAVFLNGGYVGHVDEFNGPGQWMALPPGTYEVRITLPGYVPFETRITLLPNQKFELKTNLFPGTAAADVQKPQ
jgi:hypothetical protein